MPHLFKYSEVGEATKAGKRFIDRVSIGRKAAKIIGITFYENKSDHKIIGLQATYHVGKSRK